MRGKTNGFLKAFAGIVSTVGLLLLSVQAYAAEEGDSDKWQFSVTPYLWLPSINGDLRFSVPEGSDGPHGVEIGPNDYLGSLNFVLMLKGEVRKSRWAAFTDFIYLGLSGQDSSVITIGRQGGIFERPVNTDTQISLNGLIWQLAGSYTVAGSKSTTLDILGGARYFWVNTSLDWQFDNKKYILPGSGELSESEDLFDVIVGVRGKVGLGKNWYIPYYLDIGTGSSELTTQGLTGVGYSFKWGDIFAAYRYLYYDQSDNKLLQNLCFSGPGLGVNIRF